MEKLTIKKIQEMFIAGGENISNNFEYINELNVFPVPDGDTGTNMKITTTGAAEIIANRDFTTFEDLGKTYSRALLMNARGNSGVIFSQIMKGMCQVINETKGEEFDLKDIPRAFKSASDCAYKAIASPIEGTILTVIRVIAEKLEKEFKDPKSVEEAFDFIVKVGNETLNKTPDMIKALKEAGVVDSGGYGLMKFLEGMQASVLGKKIEKTETEGVQKKTSGSMVGGDFEDKNEGFGYCCEFIMTIGAKVDLKQRDKPRFYEDELKEELSEIGNCLVTVVDDNIVKVHVHTVNPWKVLEIGQRYGEFNKVKIENMTLQFIEKNTGTALGETYISKNAINKSIQNLGAELTDQPRLIATVPTETMQKEYFENLKVDYCINYQKTGAPSIKDFLNAVLAMKSTRVIVVVDDSNYVMAAQQAEDLIHNSKIKIELINARDISVSYLLCYAYDPMSSYNDNVKTLNRLNEGASFAKIARAYKSVVSNKVKVNARDFIGMIKKEIIYADTTLDGCAKYIADQVITNARRVKGLKSEDRWFFIFVGSETEVASVQKISGYINEQYGIRTKIVNTDRPIYYFHFLY